MILLFRSLVLVQFLTFFIWIGLSFYEPKDIPENWKTAREFDGDGDSLTKWIDPLIPLPEKLNWEIVLQILMPITEVLFHLTLVFYSSFGLFFFWKYSREAYILSILLDFILHFSYGISVQYPFEQFLMLVSSIVYGVLLALIFAPSIQEKFQNRKLFGRFEIALK